MADCRVPELTVVVRIKGKERERQNAAWPWQGCLGETEKSAVCSEEGEQLPRIKEPRRWQPRTVLPKEEKWAHWEINSVYFQILPREKSFLKILQSLTQTLALVCVFLAASSRLQALSEPFYHNVKLSASLLPPLYHPWCLHLLLVGTITLNCHHLFTSLNSELLWT